MILVYWLVQTLIRCGARGLLGWRVVGHEHVPPGAAVIASNHLSNFDPPLLGSLLSRRSYYFAKIELFENRLIGAILKFFHAFPARRGEADRTAWKVALNHLRQGDQLLFFPEGTRSKTGEIQRAQPGMARLALSAGVPVVPTAIVGSNRLKDVFFRRAKLGIAFAEPLDVSRFTAPGGGKPRYDDLTETVMLEIGRLKSELEKL